MFLLIIIHTAKSFFSRKLEPSDQLIAKIVKSIGNALQHGPATSTTDDAQGLPHQGMQQSNAQGRPRQGMQRSNAQRFQQQSTLAFPFIQPPTSTFPFIQPPTSTFQSIQQPTTTLQIEPLSVDIRSKKKVSKILLF
jgi:hypothetical protein